jgi:hypothetical protein
MSRSEKRVSSRICSWTECVTAAIRPLSRGVLPAASPVGWSDETLTLQACHEDYYRLHAVPLATGDTAATSRCLWSLVRSDSNTRCRGGIEESVQWVSD